MKKVVIFLALILSIGMFLPGSHISGAATIFKDVPTNAWYYSHVKYVSEGPRQLMVGYAGNFGPLDELTVEQFITVSVVAAGRDVVVPKGQYWGDIYVPIGLELGFVLPGEFTDYKRPITRAEMARMIIRSLPLITGEKGATYNVNDIKARMVDYSSIPAELRDYVCQAYQLGVLTGGPDKKFNPNGPLTRASAAAVIHSMLDPSVRAVAVSEELWSDAEFEAFMNSPDMTYVNKNVISKVENGKIYWKVKGEGSYLIPEENNPGINDMMYNLVKIQAYHAVKIKGYLFTGYIEGSLGGYTYTRFYGNKTMSATMQYGDINIIVYLTPTKSETADKYFPGQQKGVSHYQWVLGGMHSSSDVAGFNPSMDRSKFDWTAPRFEEIFKLMCQEVYGPTQGFTFYTYALQEVDNKFNDPDNYIASFVGTKSDMNFELVYIYSEKNAFSTFWTDRPVVKE